MDNLTKLLYDTDNFIEHLTKGGSGSGNFGHSGIQGHQGGSSSGDIASSGKNIHHREEPAISEYRNLVGRYNIASAQFKDDPKVQEYFGRLKASWRSHILDLADRQVRSRKE